MKRAAVFYHVLMFGFGLLASAVFVAPQSFAHGNDDPLLGMVIIDQWERGEGEAAPSFLEAEAWLGFDLHKLRVATEWERAEGSSEHGEVQALFSRAVHAYWDTTMGLRVDLQPDPERYWAALGLRGVAPYWFDIDAALFFSDEGDTALRVKAEYEWRFTQKLQLVPEVEINAFANDNRDYHQQSGLADATFALRLRYDIRREISPYIGVRHQQYFGATRTHIQGLGGEAQETLAVVGVSLWF